MRKKELISGLKNIKELMLHCDGGNYFTKEEIMIIDQALKELEIPMTDKITILLGFVNHDNLIRDCHELCCSLTQYGIKEYLGSGILTTPKCIIKTVDIRNPWALQGIHADYAYNIPEQQDLGIKIANPSKYSLADLIRLIEMGVIDTTDINVSSIEENSK